MSVFKNGQKFGTTVVEESGKHHVIVNKLEENILAIVYYDSRIVVLDTDLQEILSSCY